MLLFGLGNTAARAAMQSTYNVELVQGGAGTVFDPKHGGGFTIQQHHFVSVYKEVNPYWPPPADSVARAAWAKENTTAQEAWRTKVRAASTIFPTCAADTVTGPNACHQEMGEYAAAHHFDPIASKRVTDPISFIPPGVFEFYRVPFVLKDLAEGRFKRVYAPTPEQRRDAELAIILASQVHLFGSGGWPSAMDSGPITRPLVHSSLANYAAGGDAILRGMRAAVRTSASYVTTADLTALARKMSVDQMLAIVPDMALFLVNFVRNPIQPSYAQRTEPGGWASWLASGGYPLSRAVAAGQITTGRGVPQFCMTSLCQCPAVEGTWGGFAACAAGCLTRKGTIGSYRNKDDCAAFSAFVAVSQDLTNPYPFMLTLVSEDPPSVWERMKRAVGGVLERDLPALVCGPGTAAAQGSANPTTKAYGAYLSWVCGRFTMPDAPVPLPAPDQDEPPPLVSFKIPWWLVVLGGVSAGAYAFSRK